jgi:hypothetical protein
MLKSAQMNKFDASTMGARDMLNTYSDEGDCPRLAVGFDLGQDFFSVSPQERKRRITRLYQLVEQAVGELTTEVEKQFHMSREPVARA